MHLGSHGLYEIKVIGPKGRRRDQRGGTNNSAITRVKVKRRGTEKCHRSNSEQTIHPRMQSQGRRETQVGIIWNVAFRAKGAGSDVKSESKPWCKQPRVALRVFGTSVNRVQWSHVEWLPRPSCCSRQGAQGEESAYVICPRRGPLLWVL